MQKVFQIPDILRRIFISWLAASLLLAYPHARNPSGIAGSGHDFLRPSPVEAWKVPWPPPDAENAHLCHASALSGVFRRRRLRHWENRL